MRETRISRRYNKHKKGHFAECAATVFMKQKGFQLIDRNVRSKFGEIDLIMQNDQNIAICEVKSVTRETNGLNVNHETYDFDPITTINHKKILKIRRTLGMLIMKHPHMGNYSYHLYVIRVSYMKSRKTFHVELCARLPL